MNTEDKRIQELYAEAFDGVRSSSELKRKVRNMAESKSNAKKNVSKIRKIAYAAAAAVVLIVAGGMVVANATRGAYKEETVGRVMFNGEEKEAYFHDFGNHVGSWRFFEGDVEYSVFIHGNVDMETTIYVVDMDSYVLASDIPEPTLNLYTDIDSSPFAEMGIDDYTGGKTLFIRPDIEDNRDFERIMFALDAEDGTEDGILGLGIADNVTTYTIMSDGSVAETFKQDVSGINGIVRFWLNNSVDNYIDVDADDFDPYTYGMEDVVTDE